MTTKKLRLKKSCDVSGVSKYEIAYTGLFAQLYNNFELSADKNYKSELLKKYSLFDVSMLDFCIADAEGHLKAKAENIKQKELDIERMDLILSGDNFKTKKEKRYKYQLSQRLARTKRNLHKDVCFGGKNNLRKVTKAAQDADKSTEYKDKKTALYEKYLGEYRQQRNRGIYLVGRANEGGNRKIDFDFTNDKIVFKPNKEEHIEIEFHTSAKQHSELKKLQQMCDAKLIAITVRIDFRYIYVTYDEQLLRGFAFDKNGYKRAIDGIKDADVKKGISRQFMQEQRARMLKDKNVNLYMSIDQNPYEISVVVGERINDDGDFKVLESKVYALKKLSKKLGVSSSDEKQKHQNNKREHEIKEVWKNIFELAQHYKVSHFVKEDLSFKKVSKANKGVGFNRQTKNVWHRELSTKAIQKHCNTNGIIIVEVNAAYSSFIGNMCHEDYDPIAAAKEILRRGIVKYVKGSSLYPKSDRISRQKLTYLFGENVPENLPTWVKLYGEFHRAGLRYRNKDASSCIVQNMKSAKSRVQVLTPSCPLLSMF